jgi:hypothetical protein
LASFFASFCRLASNRRSFLLRLFSLVIEIVIARLTRTGFHVHTLIGSH